MTRGSSLSIGRRPPTFPRALAATRPAFVLSWISCRSNSASAEKMLKINCPETVTIPRGFQIVGMAVRMESYCKRCDDTTLNGFAVICSNGKTLRRIVVEEGRWGTWRPDVLIPDGYYVAGMQMRFESYQRSGDDTAANGIRLLLRKI